MPDNTGNGGSPFELALIAVFVLVGITVVIGVGLY